jgi:hypothetical protein
MTTVVTCEINEEKRYYAGYYCVNFRDSGPIFNKTITRLAEFQSEQLADMAVDQLRQWGYAVLKEEKPTKKRRSKSAV